MCFKKSTLKDLPCEEGGIEYGEGWCPGPNSHEFIVGRGILEGDMAFIQRLLPPLHWSERVISKTKELVRTLMIIVSKKVFMKHYKSFSEPEFNSKNNLACMYTFWPLSRLTMQVTAFGYSCLGRYTVGRLLSQVFTHPFFSANDWSMTLNQHIWRQSAKRSGFMPSQRQ